MKIICLYTNIYIYTGKIIEQELPAHAIYLPALQSIQDGIILAPRLKEINAV